MHTICTIFATTFNINVFLWPVSRSRSMVMFGEYVDSMNVAIDIVSKADVFVVIGTSLKVYPAAGFINYAHHEVPKFVIDQEKWINARIWALPTSKPQLQRA